ncbi:MAG TPA: hypothetical protein VFZ66_01740 [Herpetosiphonaceae bacterium]
MLRPLPLRLSLSLVALLSVVLAALLIAGRHAQQVRIVLPEIAGDAALVITPDGRTVLIDGGADGAALATWLGNTLPFGQRHLDAVVLTRADGKTLSGQLAALKRYAVKAALLPATERRSSSLDAWEQLLEAQQVAPEYVAPGDQLMLGRCALDVLTAQDGQMTLALQCGPTVAYFLQAVDDDAETELSARDLASAALVVFPWKRPTDTPLLQRLRPAAIVFSDGGRGENDRSWADRRVDAARLYHEQIHGQIELIGDERQTMIRAERGEDSDGN